MTRGAKVLLPVLLAVLVATGPAAAHTSGEIVPFIKAADLDGRQLSLGDLVASGRVALVFWDWRRATSIRALNLLDELRTRYRSRGFEVLAIEGEGSSREGVAERVEKLRAIGTSISFPVIPDPGGRIARQFRVDATPQLFLLDGAGRIAYHLDGFRSEDEQGVVEAVRELVGDTPPPVSPLVPARRSDLAEPAASPQEAPPALRRTVLLEIAGMALILMATAGLVNSPPPPSAATTESASAVVGERIVQVELAESGRHVERPQPGHGQAHVGGDHVVRTGRHRLDLQRVDGTSVGGSG